MLGVRVRARLKCVNNSGKPGAHVRSRSTRLGCRVLGLVNLKARSGVIHAAAVTLDLCEDADL